MATHLDIQNRVQHKLVGSTHTATGSCRLDVWAGRQCLVRALPSVRGTDSLFRLSLRRACRSSLLAAARFDFDGCLNVSCPTSPEQGGLW
jgi:hypothetical protein